MLSSDVPAKAVVYAHIHIQNEFSKDYADGKKLVTLCST